MFLKSNNFSSSHQKQQKIENISLIFQGIISVKCCITATQAQPKLKTAFISLWQLRDTDSTEKHATAGIAKCKYKAQGK